MKDENDNVPDLADSSLQVTCARSLSGTVLPVPKTFRTLAHRIPVVKPSAVDENGYYLAYRGVHDLTPEER